MAMTATTTGCTTATVTTIAGAIGTLTAGIGTVTVTTAMTTAGTATTITGAGNPQRKLQRDGPSPPGGVIFFGSKPMNGNRCLSAPVRRQGSAADSASIRGLPGAGRGTRFFRLDRNFWLKALSLRMDAG